MKTITLFGLLLSVMLQLQSSCNHSKELETRIVQVIEAFDASDDERINSYIHPDYGLYILYRRGVMDEYTQVKQIDFDNPHPEYLPYIPFKADYALRYETLPEYDCGEEEWSKTGLFCDTLQRDSLLSTTALNLNRYRGDNIPSTTIKMLKDLEAHSHRLVLTDPEGGELIFYLTLINDDWYLTALDRVSSDCSA